MKEEILAAVMFFSRFIEKSETFPRDQLENFKKYLTELLLARFEKHWFPNLPTKGQGYRCIRVNCVSPVDLTLKAAASRCGFSYRDLRLPTELTVWVDPNEVCYRLGESEGSYCTLATFPLDSSSESSSSTPTNSPPSTPLQEKPMKSVQKPPMQMNQQSQQQHQQMIQQQRHNSAIDFNNKYRNHNNMAVAVPSLRLNPAPREMNAINYQQHNRPIYRCDGPQYAPLAPAFYRNAAYNNRTPYKNVLRV